MKNSENRELLGKRIKELRMERNLTQQKLSDMAAISRGTLSSIECGDRAYSVDVLHRIIKALDVTYVKFFQGVDGADALLKNSEEKRGGAR